VQVEGLPTAATTSAMRRLPAATQHVDRPTLWGAAIRIAAEHPIVGIGPDNFRQVYGRYIGRATWDTRVHANNMYLEVLAGAGAIGLVSLLWLVVASGRLVWRVWSGALPHASTAAAILAAVWLVIVGHGLVDSFLSFTTTYVLFAVAAGLACSPALAPWTPHADRV
jgi:O-antigen ligase